MKKKILVIDDEVDVLKSLKSGLENKDKDYEVLGLESGKECIEYLDNCDNLPDLILIDIMMPEMDGWQVLNRIKENNNLSSIPIVFLTAKTDDFTKKFGSTQTEDFIEKPFDLDDLKSRIDDIIKKSKSDYASLY